MKRNIVWIGEAPLKIKEVYGIKITLSTLRDWRRKGKYPRIFIKIGGRIFVDIDQFNEYISNSQQENEEKIKKIEKKKREAVIDALSHIRSKHKKGAVNIPASETDNLVKKILAKHK